MKKYLGTVTAILLMLGAASHVAAQVPPGISLLSWGVPQGGTFQQYLASHPALAQELNANPNLLFDPNWRNKHEQLKEYIQSHPKVWHGILAKGGINQYDEKWWGFVDKHPQLKNALAADPNLLYDPKWRSRHPRLQQYLNAHPRVRSRLFAMGPANMAPRSWQDFLRNNPAIGEIQNNPALIQNPDYLRRNSALQQYLQRHPGVREDLLERARWRREHRDYDDWRWRHAWDDQDEDEDEDAWRHHPPGHAYGWRGKDHPPGRAYGWEKHHGGEEEEEGEERHARGHGHGHHGGHDRD